MNNINHQLIIIKGYNMLLCFAGSMIMNEPSEDCIKDFWEKGVLKNLPVKSTNPDFIKAASLLRSSCDDKTVCEKKLRNDYSRLFKMSDSPLAPPYETIYDRHTVSGNGKSCVTDFYNSYGWESKYNGKIKDDHLGIELLFLTILIDKYLAFDDKACLSEMGNEIRRFIDTHLFPWIKEWSNQVQIHSETACYKGIAALILACTTDIYDLLKESQSYYS